MFSNGQKSTPEDYIPYAIRTQITQIDPLLDIFWQKHLHDLFVNMNTKERKNVSEQLLASQNIFWNGQNKTFEHRPTINIPFGQFCADIPAKFKKLKILANKLQISLEHLESYNEANKIADYLENMLGIIDELDTRDELEQQICKQKLHRAFIYAAANTIRHKKELIMPSNARHLSSNAVKVFINEVFLKNQLLGYWFKTLRNRQLKEHPHPLINEFLSKEQKGRQLEIIIASGYLYAIAPMLEYNANPFTIRRFLLEEKLSPSSWLLNGTVLPTGYLSGKNEQIEAIFKKQIECRITIEGNVRRLVMDFVEQLDNYHENELLPLLFAPFEVSAKGMEQDVYQRLYQYEQRLTFGVLQPLANALRHLPNSEEEYDYLYVSTRQLFGNIISAFKDFQAQPTLFGNEQASLLLGRLVAYASFLEKRRADIFTPMENFTWAENHKKSRILDQHAHAVANEYLDSYLAKKRDVQAQQNLVDKSETLFDKIFKNKVRQLEKLEELKKKMRQVQYEAHKKLFYLPDEVKAQTIHMEFDTLLITDEKIRHYAFPNGDNGISALPEIFSLPENRLDFDILAFAQQMGLRQDNRDEIAED